MSSIIEKKHRQFPDDEQKKYRKLLDNPKEITDALDRIEERHYQAFLELDALAQAHGKIYDRMAEMRTGKIKPHECARLLWDDANLIEKDHTIPSHTIGTVVHLYRNTAASIRQITQCDEEEVVEEDKP